MFATFALLIAAAFVAPLPWFMWWLAADWTERVLSRRPSASRAMPYAVAGASPDEFAYDRAA
jgi:hypothetical protein